MLKRSLIFTLVLVSLISTSWVLAADPATPSSQKTSIGSAQIDGDKVKALKEKLATKVAELRENQTRGFFGEIAALSKTSFTLASQDQEVKVRYNEDVTVYKLDATNKKIEAQVKDLKNTQGVSVLGVFEPDSKQQSAKIIFLQTLPKFYFGEVVGTDKTKGTIQIKTGQKGEITIDYEKTTLTNEYSKTESKLKKSGLSRIASGDRIQVWAVVSEDDAQKIKAMRILRLPKDLFENTENVQGVATASPAASLKPSPAATVSATPKSAPKTTPKASP